MELRRKFPCLLHVPPTLMDTPRVTGGQGWPARHSTNRNTRHGQDGNYPFGSVLWLRITLPKRLLQSQCYPYKFTRSPDNSLSFRIVSLTSPYRNPCRGHSRLRGTLSFLGLFSGIFALRVLFSASLGSFFRLLAPSLRASWASPGALFGCLLALLHKTILHALLKDVIRGRCCDRRIWKSGSRLYCHHLSFGVLQLKHCPEITALPLLNPRLATQINPYCTKCLCTFSNYYCLLLAKY